MDTSVLVVDDQDLIRDGLVTILDVSPGITVVGQAADGAEALTAARALRPDVVLMDLRMPRMDGLAATRALLRQPDPPHVLVLTTFSDDDLVLDAMAAGASGFLLKDVGRQRLVEAVRGVHAGELALSTTIARRLVDRQLHARSRLVATPALDRLTAREQEVLALVGSGATNAEVAATLHLSESTVKTYVGQLLAKLGARDRVGLVIAAYDAGLAPPANQP